MLVQTVLRVNLSQETPTLLSCALEPGINLFPVLPPSFRLKDVPFSAVRPRSVISADRTACP